MQIRDEPAVLIDDSDMIKCDSQNTAHREAKEIACFDGKPILFKSVIRTTDEMKDVEFENYLKLLICETRNLIKCSCICGRLKHFELNWKI
jgi:hypothetical protein